MSRGAKTIVLAAALAAVVAAGCGSGDPLAGMTGHQVAQGHDIADPFFADAMTVGYTRTAEDSSLPAPEDLWVWGFSDAAPSVALSNIDWTPSSTWARYRDGDLLQTGQTGRRFYDFAGRQATDVQAVTPNLFDAGITVDGGTVGADMLFPPITLVRRDGGAVALTGSTLGTVAVGPPANLQPIALPGAVGGMSFLGSDLALLYVPTPDTDPAAGVYRLAVPSGELTQLVAPAPISEWAGTLGYCPGYAGSYTCFRFMVVGCAASDAPCPGTSTPPCAIVYIKEDPSVPGRVALFAYDVNAGTELELPGTGPSHIFISPDQQFVLYDDSDFISKRYWSVCGGQQDFCPFLGGDFVVWRSDSRALVSVFTDGSGQMAAAMIDKNNQCTGAEVMPGVFWASYSPGGDRLAFLVSQDQLANVPTETMFLAQADGSMPQMIATGSLTGGRFSSDGTKLYIARSDSSSVSLDWLDLTTTPPVEHQVVGNYAGFSSGGSRRVLLIDHWNTQDTSGELALIDVATGDRQELGRAVTDFAVSGDVDASGTNVAYTVRSRVASPRDGLWLTALPP
jgi:hypothetical protein